jgi:hypothetical protein
MTTAKKREIADLRDSKAKLTWNFLLNWLRKRAAIPWAGWQAHQREGQMRGRPQQWVADNRWQTRDPIDRHRGGCLSPVCINHRLTILKRRTDVRPVPKTLWFFFWNKELKQKAITVLWIRTGNYFFRIRIWIPFSAEFWIRIRKNSNGSGSFK